MFKKVFSIILSAVMLTSIFCVDFTSLAQAKLDNKTVTVVYCQSEARKMLKMVNDFRTGKNAWYWNENDTKKIKCNNLAKLDYDYDLERIAMLRAVELTENFDHTRPNGESCFTAYGDTDFNSIGENIAMGSDCFDTQFFFELWQENNDGYYGQGHRRNMLSDGFTAIGIACVKYQGIYYWVQEFRSPTVDTNYVKPNDEKTKVKIQVPHTHKYVQSKIIESATCTKDGKAEYKCSCGLTKIKTLNAGHTYTTKVVKPTYTSSGYTLHTCTRCKKSYKDKKTKKLTLKNTTLTLTAGKKAFTAKWKKVSAATGYQLQYATDSKFTKSKKTVTISKNSTKSKKVSKLKANKKYYVRVRTYKTVKVNGKNKKVYSSWSKAKTVKTK